MKLEKMGVPTAPVVTMVFAELVKKVAYNGGMPNKRFTFVPHPIVAVPASVCRDYLQGNDPITGKIVIQEIIEALTKPLTEPEKKVGFLERAEPRLLGPDTAGSLQNLFLKNGWTDYLPIVLPTEEKVAEMLKGTSRKPDEVVGKMQASGAHPMWSYTVEKVAVNAVMAGAKPEYFPVILAIASTGVTSLFTSTTSFARAVVVNGPIRNKIGMNSGIGSMGPFNHANATIGRAWTLVSLNLGGSGMPGVIYQGSQGSTVNYNNNCVPENEEALPSGWEPLHVQKGFKPEESVVSVFSGWGIGRADFNRGGIIHVQIPFFLQTCSPFAGATLYLDPLVAVRLKEEGFDTKKDLVQWAYKSSLITIEDYWNKYQLIRTFNLPKGEKGVEPYASWLKLPKDALKPRFEKPEDITVLVVGGGTNPAWQLGDFKYIASASVDKWR